MQPGNKYEDNIFVKTAALKSQVHIIEKKIINLANKWIPLIFTVHLLHFYPRTKWGKQTFIFHAAKDWNSLPNDLKECIFFIYF